MTVKDILKKNNMTVKDILGKNTDESKDKQVKAPKDENLPAEDDTQKETKEDNESAQTFAEKYYDRIDRVHADILEKCCVMCRSDNNGRFTDITRIETIRELLKDSGYHETFTPSSSIWIKGKINYDMPVYLVSAHCDTVDTIRACHSTLDDDGYYTGTYDNAGTNAAAVIAMLEGSLPDNVIFSFNADEETGRFAGAKATIDLLKLAGITDPVCIALDVTYEGFREGLLSSIENCVKDSDFLNEVTHAALNGEGEDRTFCFVKKSKKAIPDNLPQKYLSSSTGMCDEAFGYAQMGKKTFSLCLPVNGNMHGDTGVIVRQPVFEGYVNSLEMVLYSLTKTHPELVNAKKIENQTLLARSKELIKEEKEQRRLAYSSYESYCCLPSYSGYSGGYFDCDYDNECGSFRTSYNDDFSGYYGFDEEYMEQFVAENAELYDRDDKGLFISDAIKSTYPQIYEQLEYLKARFDQMYDDYMGYLEELNAEQGDFDDERLGYVDELE